MKLAYRLIEPIEDLQTPGVMATKITRRSSLERLRRTILACSSRSMSPVMPGTMVSVRLGNLQDGQGLPFAAKNPQHVVLGRGQVMIAEEPGELDLEPVAGSQQAEHGLLVRAVKRITLADLVLKHARSHPLASSRFESLRVLSICLDTLRGHGCDIRAGRASLLASR